MSVEFSPMNFFPRTHRTLTPSDTINFADNYLVYCGSAGTIVAIDADGTSVSYSVAAGDILPVPCKRVNATGTTVTPIIGLY